MQSRKLCVLGIVLIVALLAAGCGGGGKKKANNNTTTSGPASSKITAPSNIKSAGTLVFCSDITYPPEESYKAGTTTPEGSDIDIGNEVAKLMG
jgi:ABC-type amino acid transport substrate-binding protein